MDFANVSEILSIEQKLSAPKELRISPIMGKETNGQPYIQFPHTLLNPRDWYILEVGIAAEHGKKPVIEPKGRIAGVKQIVFRENITPPIKGNDPAETLRSLISIIGGFVSVIVAITAFSLQRRKKELEKYIEKYIEQHLNDK